MRQTISEADAGEPAFLRAELEALRSGTLHKHTVAEGVDADAVGVALGQHSPEAALIELIVAGARQHNGS
eukprot:COSAG02_NODE_11728_length_1665_cov_232.445083_1_plen_70_part_00